MNDTNSPKLRSFRDRCADFWAWFQKNEPQLLEISQSDDAFERDEVIDFLDQGLRKLGNICYNMEGEHELTFSTGGSRALFYLLPYLAAGAPKELKEKWTISPFITPDEKENQEGFALDMNGTRISTNDIVVKYDFDENSQLFHLAIFIPGIEEMDDYDAFMIFYTLLDFCLGECMVERFVGSVNKADNADGDTIQISRLREHIITTIKQTGSRFIENPSEAVSVYKLTPQNEAWIRSDVIAGNSCFPDLIEGYYTSNPLWPERFEEFGSKVAFLTIDYSELETDEKQIDIRHRMEVSLNEMIFDTVTSDDNQTVQLKGTETGRIIGGAIGTHYLYIDILLFDEQDFMTKISSWAKQYEMPIYYSDYRHQGDLSKLKRVN